MTEISSFYQLHEVVKQRIENAYNLPLLEQRLKECIELVNEYVRSLSDKRKRLTQIQTKDSKRKEPRARKSVFDPEKPFKDLNKRMGES